jgi:type I restriction enzyme, S subunit
MMPRTVPISEAAIVNPRYSAATTNGSRTVAFLPMAGLSERGFIASAEERSISDVSQGYTYFEEGDVLLAKITPCLENGKAAVVQNLPHRVGFGSTEFHVLRPKQGVDARFLFYMIWNPLFRHEASRNMTGSAGQKRVPADFVSNYRIPLPALQEQRRIAAILDKADAIRRKREEGIRLTEELLRSTFLDMFGDPATNRKNFPEVRLENVATIQRGKFTPRPRNDPRFYDGAYPFVQTGDIANCGGLLRSWHQTLNEEGIAVSKSFPKGALLIAIVGATIGETAILEREMYCPDSVIGIQAHSGVATSEYLEYLLRFHKQRFRDAAPETARANINLDTLKPLVIPCPNIDLQRRFSKVFRRCYQLTDRIREQLTGENDLFGSLVQRAFRGGL